jgi:hypothetical protein
MDIQAGFKVIQPNDRHRKSRRAASSASDWTGAWC